MPLRYHPMTSTLSKACNDSDSPVSLFTSPFDTLISPDVLFLWGGGQNNLASSSQLPSSSSYLRQTDSQHKLFVDPTSSVGVGLEAFAWVAPSTWNIFPLLST